MQVSGRGKAEYSETLTKIVATSTRECQENEAGSIYAKVCAIADFLQSLKKFSVGRLAIGYTQR